MLKEITNEPRTISICNIVEYFYDMCVVFVVNFEKNANN